MGKQRFIWRCQGKGGYRGLPTFHVSEYGSTLDCLLAHMWFSIKFYCTCSYGKDCEKKRAVVLPPDFASQSHKFTILLILQDCDSDGDLECVAGNDDFPGCSGLTSMVTVSSGCHFFVFVTGVDVSAGNFVLTTTCTAV